MNTPTPHNAAEYGQIAKTVIMSGDPLRAKMIAETYIDNPVLYNQVRGMLGFTGTHNGKPLSVQGHGMGGPSVGIYTYELYNFYDVESIIRVGTCGAMDPDVKVGSVILVEEAITDSNYGYQYGIPAGHVAKASEELLAAAEKSASDLGVDCLRGMVCSSDVFYNRNETMMEWSRQGALGVEMEAFALYTEAAAAKKKALTILTVTDHITTKEALSSEQRQLGLKTMIEIALGIVDMGI